MQYFTRDLRVKTIADQYNILAYGALASTDITTQLQNVINTLSSGTIIIPPGSYTLSSTVTVNKSSISIKGSGMWNTILTRSGDYGDTIVFTGTDASGTLISGNGISNLTFTSTGQTTSGAHLKVNGAQRFNASDLFFLQGFIGIDAKACTAAYFSNIYLVFTNLFSGSATGRKYFSLTSGSSNYAHPSCGDLFVNNFNLRGNTSNNDAQYGVYVESSDGLWFSNGHLGHTTSANIALNAADASNKIDLVFFDNVMSDSSTGDGLAFTGNSAVGRNIQFSNCTFKGGSASNIGISSDGSTTFNNVQFSNCSISEYVNEGIKLSSTGIKNWLFSSMQVRGNSTTGSGSAAGANITNVQGISFVGGKYGGQNINATATGNQSYGISIGTGVANVMIDNVDATNNATGDLSIDSTITNSVDIKGCWQTTVNVASASTVTLPPIGELFHITGTTTITSVSASRLNRRVTLIFDGALTFTDGSNLKLAGDFVTTADDTITIQFDGSNWYEVCRSVN